MTETILIAGCGVSGRAAARLGAAVNAKIILLDENDTDDLREFASSLEHKPEQVIFGWHPGIEIPRADVVVLSPGIRSETPLFQQLHAAGPCIGELEYSLKHLKVPFIGITGTNGKTTTTELTAKLFQANGMRAAACGNIGYAASDAAIDSIKGKIDIAVMEISSFQLEPMKEIHPAAAALLNLASDHLDRHGGMAEYAAIKFKLLKYLVSDKGFVNSNLRIYPQSKGFTTFSAEDETADFSLKNGCLCFRNDPLISTRDLGLEGPHNMENILASMALLSAIRGESALHDPAVLDVLRNFHPAPHRLQCFLEKDGVRYIDDSKATNPHAVNAACKAVQRGKNLILLLGGLDKGMVFSELRISYPYIRHAFLFGKCRNTIAGVLSDGGPEYTICDGPMQNAVTAACRFSHPGDVVLFSPATASFDEFHGYAERGEYFQKFVKEAVDEKK